ncbi:UDP-N-acetylglucosamine 2-epimerase (non-hydrolysing)/GDP/UDP-N,N'-diacetylbacillosamine 2-epimerase (hydrolysing) [Shewanella morhuae]|uniref:UDP-N-acetylglucosamine 2-epimerase n=1 Tax=Shewanella TaxID=22 RepID=UPI000956E9A1|nr:UDP-N-acetylglucosamine 2-epimerase [Shewanella morhuae]SIQ49081.1 UDP-N-acetylglucosamine 2-epimerase (non-hydrolysing)/GDP/UDP-N,N'-diacetylbacillosamine 2-epimerase (hydrolysing) [Shewanella morhuae]
MRILALTSIRSDYDLLSPLYTRLHNDIDIELKLLVGGTHNSAIHDYTIKDIHRDGFDVLLEIDSLINSDTPKSRLKSASILLLSAVDSVSAFSPDLIIYAGDREDVMIGALLGGYLSIPTLHFYGGDHASDSYIDNSIRHAVSKLSTVHFVSTAIHKARLLALKEPENRIFDIGSIALDKFKNIVPIADIKYIIAGKIIDKPAALVIFHPIKDEVMKAPDIVNDILMTLIKNGYHCFIGSPNSDPGNALIVSTLSRLAAQYSEITLYGNLPRDEFLNLFSACDIIVGNSSAGLLEAASIPIPCLNVGLRQKGRDCSDNVLFVDSSAEAIQAGLNEISSTDFALKMSRVINIYGDSHSAEKAHKLIKSLNFKSLLNKPEDPLYV